jgi:hypothetical protein
MSWEQYNILIQPLILKFGAHKYNSQYISNQYFFWKSKDKSELLEIVNECISFNQQLDLKPKQQFSQNINPTKNHIEMIDNLKITDGYLDNLLKSNNCKNLLELIDKQRICK